MKSTIGSVTRPRQSRGGRAWMTLLLPVLFAACGSPDAREASVHEASGSAVGTWELEQYPTRERLEFHENGIWEAWGDWEMPGEPEVIVGTYAQRGDSILGSSAYGVELALKLRGDTLEMADGTRYVRTRGP